MKNEWIKIKVIRDIKKIFKEKNEVTLYSLLKSNDTKSKFTKEYRNLIELVINTLHEKENLRSVISMSYLKRIDFNLFVEVSKFNNVTIVDQPTFLNFSIKDNMTHTHQNSVVDFEGDLLEILKNSNNSFYVYKIEKKYTRYKEIHDNKFYKINTKNKLEKIKQLNEDI